MTSENLPKIKTLDLTWMLKHAIKAHNTPMWVGYNSLLFTDTSVQQKVSHLPPINRSPTDISVVRETMQQSLKIGQELQQKYVEVTHDLAIAMPALRIQNTEKLIFDNLFIHLGSFHIMMANVHAIGTFIDECGLTEVMVDSELLASGSVRGFVGGKHFNRCK